MEGCVSDADSSVTRGAREEGDGGFEFACFGSAKEIREQFDLLLALARRGDVPRCLYKAFEEHDLWLQRSGCALRL